jgi:diacylglycerol kinase
MTTTNFFKRTMHTAEGFYLKGSTELAFRSAAAALAAAVAAAVQLPVGKGALVLHYLHCFA